MMMWKVGNGYSLWTMLNDNLTIGLTDKIENRDVEYCKQALDLSPGL